MKKVNRIIALTLALLLLVMTCFAPMVGIVAADDEDDDFEDNDDDDIDDDDGDDVDDDFEKAMERELDIEINNEQVEIESEFETDEMENEFEIRFLTAEGIAMNLEYDSEVNSTEYELELDVKFLRLVEYIDGNGNGVYDEDEAVQTINLAEIAYSYPTVNQITSTDNEEGYKIESHSQNADFDFQIVAYTFPKHAVIEESTVNPTEIKIDIVINGFPYQEDSSVLALLISANSEMEMETGTINEEEDIEIESDTAAGYFSWSDKVMVDDVQKTVNSTVISTEEEGTLIVMSYPNGTEIVHDPRLGVNILSSSIMGFPWLYFVVGAAIIASAVVGAIWISRPRIQNSTYV